MKRSSITSRWALACAITSLLAIGAWLACRATPAPDASPLAGVVLELPDTVLSYTGEEAEVTEAERTILPPDTRFAKSLYKGDGPERIHCQIVLSGNDRRSIHRPEACLRGQGWTISNGGTVPITLADGTTLDVMKLVIDQPIELRNGEKTTLRSLYLYWFVSKEMTTPFHHVRLTRTYSDLLLHNQTHRWAYIIVSAPVLKGLMPGGKDEEETLETLEKFIAEAAPQFQRVGTGVDVPPLPPSPAQASLSNPPPL